MRSLLEIRDPVHGPIIVSKDELQIIDSPYIQRLRGIKQTGFAELAFPGATHNRYSHSLGAFHLAGRVFDQVFQDFDFKDAEEMARFRQSLRMAALLHDVGHGPLSHAIEQAMPQKADVLGGEGQASHEDYSELIITRSSLTDLLKKVYGNDTPEVVVSLVRNDNRNPELFRAGKRRHNIFPALSALISGEIDVDRMDYMSRDSLYCGISYGNFDRNWLISNLGFFEEKEDVFLALDSRAIYAFEDFLLSRYHMYLMVYLHHKSVVYDEMLYQFLMTDTSEARIPSDVEEYLQVDDYWLMSRLRRTTNHWADRIIHQKPYRMLLEVHSDQNSEAQKIADDLEDKLKKEHVGYFRSSSTGLLSKYVGDTFESRNPLYVLYSDRRFISAQSPGVEKELIQSATELFSRYRSKRIIDRIFAERSLGFFIFAFLFACIFSLTPRSSRADSYERNLQDLQELVEIASHHSNGEGQKEIAKWLKRKLKPLGFKSSWQKKKRLFIAEREGKHSAAPLLLLVAHMDGPFDIQNVRSSTLGRHFLGPNSLDNKSGIVALLRTLEIHAPSFDKYHIKVLVVGDEEAMAQYSRRAFQHAARGASLALVFEPSWVDSENRESVIIPTNIPGILRVDIVIETEPYHSGVVDNGHDASHILHSLQAFLKESALAGSVKFTQGQWQSVNGLSKAAARITFRYTDESTRAVFKQILQSFQERYADDYKTLTAKQKLFTTARDILDMPREPKIVYHFEDRSKVGRLILPSRLWTAYLEARAKLNLGSARRGKTRTFDMAALLAPLGIATLTGIGPRGGSHHRSLEYTEIDSIDCSANLAGLTATHYLK